MHSWHDNYFILLKALNRESLTCPPFFSFYASLWKHCLMETLHAALVSFTLCSRTLPRLHSGCLGFRCMTRSGSDYPEGLHGTAVRSTKRISVSLRQSFVSCAQSSYHPELLFSFLFLRKRAFSKRAQTGLLECLLDSFNDKLSPESYRRGCTVITGMILH